MRYIQKIIAYSFLLITLVISGIVYTWYNEWQKIGTLEIDNKRIDEQRHEINDVHIHLIELFLLGETILEWDDDDLKNYHTQRMAIDSMLYRFKKIYPAERIDSVCGLLEDKERQMCRIVQVLDE